MSQKTYPQLLREAASLIEEALNSNSSSRTSNAIVEATSSSRSAVPSRLDPGANVTPTITPVRGK